MKTSYKTIPSMGMGEIYWPSQSFDPRLDHYKHLLQPQMANGRVSFLGRSYKYVYDLQASEFIYFCPQFRQLLGYDDKGGNIDGSRLLRLALHPDDQIVLCKGYRFLMEYLLKVPNTIRPHYRASLDFRVKAKGTNSLRLLQILSEFATDNKGNIVFVKGQWIDITHWDKTTASVLSINGPEDHRRITIPSSDRETKSAILSSREQQVLNLLALGLSSKAVAKDLMISPHTVNTHRQNMLQKLGLKKTTRLVHFAHEQGLI